MNISALEQFYLDLDEPDQSCFMALRDFILAQHEHITAEWKYKLPFFYYKGKMLCYLWKHKAFKQPYVAFADGYLMDHPLLLQEDRKRMKILLINPKEDIPIKLIAQFIEAGIKILEAKKK
jgi:hypothetical protein